MAYRPVSPQLLHRLLHNDLLRHRLAPRSTYPPNVKRVADVLNRFTSKAKICPGRTLKTFPFVNCSALGRYLKPRPYFFPYCAAMPHASGAGTPWMIEPSSRFGAQLFTRAAIGVLLELAVDYFRRLTPSLNRSAARRCLGTASAPP